MNQTIDIHQDSITIPSMRTKRIINVNKNNTFFGFISLKIYNK